MQVREIMTRDPKVTDPNTTIRDAARRMRDYHLGDLPVCENDQLIGMVTDRDIVVRAVAEDRSPGNTVVRQVMSEGVYYCFEDDDVEGAARIMAEHEVRRLPVLNRDKRLVGMLGIADLARSAPNAAIKALEGIAEPTIRPRR